MNRFWKITASFFYLGTCPIASGTAGTAGAVAVFALLHTLFPGWFALNIAVLVALAIASALCIPAGNWAERTLKKKDPGLVVLDEVAGYFVTILFIPAEDFKDFLFVAIAGFFVFRFFDIVKPPPVRRMERLGGGLGILVDDLMAGVYSNICLWGLWWLAPVIGLR